METTPDSHDDRLHDSTILSAGANERTAATATMDRDSSDPDATVTDPMNDDHSSPPPQWGPPPPPPPPQPRRSWLDVPIARDHEDGRVAGVVAGVSRAYGFDRRTTRIAVALGALVIPGIIAVYIAAMIFLPGRDEEPRTLRAIATDPRRRPLMIVLGILAIATGFGSWAFWGGLGWGFGLVAIGVVLWLAPNLGRGSTVQSAAPLAADQPTSFATPVASSSTMATQKPRRRRYPIQAIGLGATSVGALLAVIGNNTGWWDVTTYSIVLGVLIALIAATVIGAVVNRSWYGIPVLLLLTAGTVGLVITHPDLDGGIGQRTIRPTTVAGAQTEQHLAVGELTIDLTDVPLGAQPLEVDASVGYGRIHVIVPDDVELVVHSDVNAGRIVIDGNETVEGFHRDDTFTIPAPAATGTAPTIDLDLAVGAGEIEISRANR